MLGSPRINHLPSKTRHLIFPTLTRGTSPVFESEGEVTSFRATGSAAITVDLKSQLFREIIEWKNLPASPLRIQILEIQDWEGIVEKLNALEVVSGMLNELPPDQMETFETSVRRRPFFG
jgi:hypothetical protein